MYIICLLRQLSLHNLAHLALCRSCLRIKLHLLSQDGALPDHALLAIHCLLAMPLSE